MHAIKSRYQLLNVGPFRSKSRYGSVWRGASAWSRAGDDLRVMKSR